MPAEKRILIIDDESNLRKLLARMLSLEGYTVHEAADAKHAFRILDKEMIHLVISDVKLPDANGVVLSQQIKSVHPDTEIIVLTAYGNIQDGVQAIKNGAYDYLVKGDDNNRLLPLVNKAMDRALLQHKVKELQQKISHQFSFEDILGTSPAIQQAVDLAKKVAVTDTTVLLTGETGTGKEVFAQAIHRASPRHSHPFVAMNCSAFAKDILESELFGHKAGAFTGAVKDKTGLIEEAHKGTLFLDEIGEMPMDLQAKLLRFLESGEFYQVGGTKPVRVNIRVIAATNRNLAEAVAKDCFRLDMYYRLSAFHIQLPSLLERKKDIPVLANYFVQVFAQKMNKEITGIAPAAMEKLQAHCWKGNIRELKNVIERAVILANDHQVIAMEHLPFDIQYNLAPPNIHTMLDLASIEKQHILRVLEHTRGNKTKAAELLGIGLTTLYAKVKEYGLHFS